MSKTLNSQFNHQISLLTEENSSVTTEVDLEQTMNSTHACKSSICQLNANFLDKVRSKYFELQKQTDYEVKMQ